MGLRELVRVFFDRSQSVGNVHVSNLSRRYYSSSNPYGRRWLRRILLSNPSTTPSKTMFSGLKQAPIPSAWRSGISAHFS